MLEMNNYLDWVVKAWKTVIFLLHRTNVIYLQMFWHLILWSYFARTDVTHFIKNHLRDHMLASVHGAIQSLKYSYIYIISGKEGNQDKFYYMMYTGSGKNVYSSTI